MSYLESEFPNLTFPDSFPEIFPTHTYCEPDSLIIRNFLKDCTRKNSSDPDNTPYITWYDENNQWLDPDSCNYGSGQDQMTMTYVSFTGYLRCEITSIHDKSICSP